MKICAVDTAADSFMTSSLTECSMACMMRSQCHQFNYRDGSLMNNCQLYSIAPKQYQSVSNCQHYVVSVVFTTFLLLFYIIRFYHLIYAIHSPFRATTVEEHSHKSGGFRPENLGDGPMASKCPHGLRPEVPIEAPEGPGAGWGSWV